jgi:hypothetical protein
VRRVGCGYIDVDVRGVVVIEGCHRGTTIATKVDGGTRTGGGMVMEGWRVTMQYKIIGQ